MASCSITHSAPPYPISGMLCLRSGGTGDPSLPCLTHTPRATSTSKTASVTVAVYTCGGSRPGRMELPTESVVGEKLRS